MRLAGLLLVLLALGAQEPRNPDDYVGPEDPAHQGQPKTCSNSKHITAVHRDCKCEKKTAAACDPSSAMEDSRCYVYCRKPACKCAHEACETE
jgi:hypothetical protein